MAMGAREMARRKVAFRLDDVLKDYYPDGIEKRTTVCYHLADEVIDLFGGIDHFVTFDEDGWFIEHSVPCRLMGALDTCEFNTAVREIADEPHLDQFGRWRITEIDEEGLPSLEKAQPTAASEGAES